MKNNKTEETNKLLEEKIAEIIKTNEEKGKCHFCNINPPTISKVFWVNTVGKTDWGKLIKSSALSALALPLVGLGAIATGRTDVKTIELQLLLCDECQKKHKNIFRQLYISKKDYKKHPSYSIAEEIGFNKILDEAGRALGQLPS